MQWRPAVCCASHSSAKECIAGLFTEQILKIQVMQTGLKRHAVHTFSPAQQPRAQARLLHLWQKKCTLWRFEVSTSSCGRTEEQGYRKRLLNYHSKNEGKKEFMMFCHSCITLKQWLMVMDIGRSAKHTYKWCEGRHHPLHCPPPHFYYPQGLL